MAFQFEVGHKPLMSKLEPGMAHARALLEGSDAEPRYRQVQTDLARQITEGSIAEGQPLPSEEALCKMYGVSRITVRKALDGLRGDGCIESRKGAGSFVIRPPRVFYGSLVKVLTGAWDTRIFISERWRIPPATIQAALLLEPGEKTKVWEIALIDRGKPFVHTEYYLPAAIAYHVSREDIERLRSVTRAVEDRLGDRVGRALQTIEPAIATARIARHLQIKERTPILRMVRTYFSRNGHPLHLALVHAHPEFYRYTVELAAR